MFSNSYFTLWFCALRLQKKHPRMEEEAENKGKGGRPKSEVKRKKRITINCTGTDYRVAKSKAERAGLSLSEYGMRAIMGKALPLKLSPELVDQLRQLTGMANNLNQIAKAANQGSRLNLEMLETLEEIKILIKEIRK